MMKKITLLFLLMFAFCWHSNAQVTAPQNFGANGPDSAPTVLTINSGDITVNGSAPIDAISLGTFTTHYNSPTGTTTYCDNWYAFDLAVTGGVADGTSILAGCDTDFNGLDITGFTTLTITSNDIDDYTDTVYFDIDLDVTYTPVTPPNCDALLTETTNVSTSGDISWSSASGGPTGYFISAGTTTGGTDLANNVDNGALTSYSLGALMEGTTYYVTITPYNVNGNAMGCTEQSFTTLVHPANDECTSAISLTVNADLECTTVTSGTNVFATESSEMETSGAITGTPYTDVWYNFNATSEYHTISLTNIVAVIGTSIDMGMALYDATSGCGASLAAPIRDSDPNSFTVTGLTIGTTYLLRVYGWSNTQSASAQTTFDVCVGVPPAPPANDDCNGAIVVTPSSDNTCTTAVSGTTENAYDSNDGCGTSGKDVWYSFTAAVDGTYTVTVDETFESGFTSTYVTAYEGACGALTQVGSSTSCTNTSDLIVSTVSGQTYYVNVRSSSTTNYAEFDLCIYVNPPAPANDDCENATPISVSTDSSCNNAISGTTQSATDSTDGCGTSGRDVWYAFTAPADGDFVITETETFDSSSSTTYVTAYEGSCGALTQVGSTTSCTNSNALTITAVSGTTYYVNVRSSSATGYTEFDLCIFPLVVPENDACEDAITINAGDSLTGDTTYATNVENLTPCDGGTVGTTCSGGDATLNDGTIDFGAGVWYVYSSAGNESVSIEVTDFDLELQVFSGMCGSLVCVAGDDDSSLAGSGSFVCFDSTVATDYYIYVDGHASNSGTFTLSLNTNPLAPANDECSTAEALTLDVEITGDNTGATDSGVTGDCFTGAVADLWYSFVAPASGEVTITTSAAQYGVYTDCAGTLVGACNTSVVGDLTNGTTYYVRVSDDGTARAQAPGAFTLMVSESTSLSTAEFNSESLFAYYPNPVNDNLTLKAQKEISNVSVYNMLGQEVYRNAPNSVDNLVNMSDLQSGAYFVKVTIDNVTETIKVIKK